MKSGNNDNAGYSNRLLDALRVYAEQDAQLKIANPRGHSTDRSALQLKYLHYTNIYKAFKKGANREEKKTLRYIRHERAKLRAKLRPTLVRRVRYSRIMDVMAGFLVGRYTMYKWHNQTLQNDQKDVLRMHNLTNLQDGIKKAGFNISVEGPMQKMVDLNLPEFHLRYNDPLHCKNTDYVLHFKKIPGSDIYYFDKFDATARPTLQSVLNNDSSSVRQSFSLLDSMNVSAREAANLVNGHAVSKEINGKEIWHYLDITRRNDLQNYPYKTYTFDLEKALAKLPIKQLESPGQRSTLLRELKAGNNREVTISRNGQPIKYTIEAAPNIKTINFFDSNNRLQDMGAIVGDSRNKAKQKLTEMIVGQDNGIIDMRKTKRGQSI
jgi:hypothetical protein